MYLRINRPTSLPGLFIMSFLLTFVKDANNLKGLYAGLMAVHCPGHCLLQVHFMSMYD
uniref:Uncharacterized protein n=1 Tax=Anguilla anguilla TaxID=7936 RepID=A0A0E9S2P8_ANGAN